jgi:hypothetical protein
MGNEEIGESKLNVGQFFYFLKREEQLVYAFSRF